MVILRTKKIPYKIFFLIVLFMFPVFLLFDCIADNNEPKAIFGEWVLFKIVDKKKNDLLCYMMSIPKNRYDNFNKRGESFFTVLKYRTSERPQIFLSYGQSIRKKIIASELNIEKRKFPIMTNNDKAWAYNYFDDENIIEELMKSVIFSVEVEYENNKKLIDIYSLVGFLEAYQELLKMCE